MREYFQDSNDFNEAYGGSSGSSSSGGSSGSSSSGGSSGSSSSSGSSGSSSSGGSSGSSSSGGTKSKSDKNTSSRDCNSTLTLWKFFGLDKLSSNQLECITGKGSGVLECLSKCKTERCRYKCSGKLGSSVNNCLISEEEQPEEEETVEEVETELEVGTRFMFNHLDNIPNEGSYLGGSYSRFTPIEGDSYTVNVQSPIYPELAGKFLEKNKGRRGELIEREEHIKLGNTCRNSGGFLRGGNHTNDC